MNPIMQALNQGQARPQSNIANVLNMLRTGNPNAIYQSMMSSNPQFRDFVNTNAGKTPEQIAKENGVDIGLLQTLMH